MLAIVTFEYPDGSRDKFHFDGTREKIHEVSVGEIQARDCDPNLMEIEEIYFQKVS